MARMGSIQIQAEKLEKLGIKLPVSPKSLLDVYE
jgi:hypothetical protein